MNRHTRGSGGGSGLEERLLGYLAALADSGELGSIDDPKAGFVLNTDEKSIVRQVLVEHEAMLMRGFGTGRVHGSVVRGLMRIRDGVESRVEAGQRWLKRILGLLNVLAYGARSLPRLLYPALERTWVRWFPGRRTERRVRAAIYRSGLQPEPLLDFVNDLPQRKDCIAYRHDRSRNIVVGAMVGVDVLPCGNRWAIIEANTGAGQADQWRLPSDKNPFIENMLDFAKERGFRNLWVINNDRGLHESQDRSYREASARTGVRVQIIEPASIPVSPHRRSPIVPPLDDADTLCVRIRNFPCLPDFVLSDKRHVQETFQAYFRKNRVQDVFVPDTAPGWLERMNWASGGFPNIVSKIPDADKGIGVAFYKAENKRHALDLVSRRDDSDFQVGGLLGLLSRQAKSDERLLQPYVPSDVTADGRLEKYRMNLLVTPMGGKLLSVTIIGAAKPVPDSLPYGVVSDPYPFLVNAFEGSSRRRPTASELAALEPLADILAEAMADNLERRFSVTGDA